ncbi:MAG: NADH:flavin oxidoreductase [Pseudomonadota bacterium]
MAQYDALLKPLTIKGLTIRNRVMSTAHTSGAGEDGKPKERYQAYHEEKAKGGIGLTMIGGSTAIAPDTPGADMLHLDASTDDIIPYYQQISGRIHKHGAKIFAQLAHMGRRANWDNDRWLWPVAPSRVREPAHRSFPKEMEEWDFKRLREGFASAAGRVKRGGIDGLELSATHGHLIDQFWSQRTNMRQDKYGGSIENRLRFTFEILDAVREVVGDDYILGLRMSVDELFRGGLSGPECIEIAQALTSNGRLDYISVLAGQAEDLPSHAVIFPNMSMPAAPYIPFVSAFKASLDVPVFHAQRINDINTANRIISEGHVDMVAMTRPHMADPYIMRKLMEGRADDIRPCVGANYCIDRLYSGGQAYCLHNVATGREDVIPHTYDKTDAGKKVVIIGGGVAGLEAARICAVRGHDVVLHECTADTGGQVTLAGKAPWRDGLTAISRWIDGQARKHGADIRLNSTATSPDILSQEPDVVIVATGGVADKTQIKGADLLTTTADILSGAAKVSETVLIFDDNGRENALSCAEYMASRDVQIEFVTADPQPGHLLERTTRPTFLKNLYKKDVVFTPNHRLIEVYIEGNRLVAVLLNDYTGAEEERVVDQVIIEAGTKPHDGLYFDLRPQSKNLGAVDLDAFVNAEAQTIENNPGGQFQLFRIGDAVASRNIHAALLDAARLCKAL